MLPGPSIPFPDGDLSREAPWLNIDFRSNPSMYIALIKEYCWEGNANNSFVVQNNTVREVYSSYMMFAKLNSDPAVVSCTLDALWSKRTRASEWAYIRAWNSSERVFCNSEPSVTDVGMWLLQCIRYVVIAPSSSLLNSSSYVGATVFGKMWADKNKPDWNQDYKFPLGTCVFKAREYIATVID